MNRGFAEMSKVEFHFSHLCNAHGILGLELAENNPQNEFETLERFVSIRLTEAAVLLIKDELGRETMPLFPSRVY